jgi:hypothetical protein
MLTLDTTTATMGSRADAQDWAQGLFKRSAEAGMWRRLWLRLLGRSSGLRALGETTARAQRHLGRRTVEIAAIVGSEGRVRDFDSCFAPLGARTRDRWVSVARARHAGRPLPPVQLVLAEDGYYVRDGHHRISVAYALGEQFIEAEVVGA